MGLRDELEGYDEAARRKAADDAQRARDEQARRPTALAEFRQFLREFVQVATERGIPAKPIPAYGKWKTGVSARKEYNSGISGWTIQFRELRDEPTLLVGVDGKLYAPRRDVGTFESKGPIELTDDKYLECSRTMRPSMLSVLSGGKPSMIPHDYGN